MTVPYAFGAATTAIPLSQLDDNFNTTITLGNTAIQLGNTVTTLNNMTLANVTISSGNVTITNVTVTTANATTVNTTTLIATTANVTTGNVTNLVSGNVSLTGGAINGTTLGATTAASANVTTLTTSSTVTHNGGTANGVAYLNGSKVLTTGSALTFTSGKNLGIGTASPAASFHVNETDVSGTDITVSRFSTTSGGVVNLVCSDLSAIQPLWTLQTGTGENLAFKQGASEQMRLTSTGLGIGTSSPATQLHVSGSSPIIRLSDTDGGGEYCQISGNSGSGSLSLQADEGNTAGSSIIAFRVDAAERLRITSVGNVSIGGTADRATTVGTAALNIFNGTAPVGTLTNGISIYSSAGEAYVMDAAGNATLFSPHDAETNEWIFKSKHTPTGKVLRIDVERLLKFVNDHFGLDAVQEFIEP